MNDRHRTPPPAPRVTVALPLPAGARLGPFEVQRLLAKGATSYVYLATDHALALPVAIQEYLPERLVERDGWLQLHAANAWHEDVLSRGMQLFIEESRLLARCEHPALVRVNHLFEANGTAYRVMPFHAGERLTTLRDGLSAPPAEGPLRALAEPLLGALDTIHRLDLHHGGVTPGNILLVDGDLPLLLAPGTAEGEIRSDLVETLMATVESQPGSLQPDPAPTGATADLCALAEVLRYCVTGATAGRPANVRGRETLAELVAREDADPPWPVYSVEFLSAIDAATSPFAEDWPTSVAQFRLWLQHGAPRARATAARVHGRVSLPSREAAHDAPATAADAGHAHAETHPDRIALPARPDDPAAPAGEPFFLPLGPLAAEGAPGPHDILHAHAHAYGDEPEPLLAPDTPLPRPAAPAGPRWRGWPAKLAFGGVLAALAVVVIAWVSGAWNLMPAIPLAPDAAEQLARTRPTPPTTTNGTTLPVAPPATTEGTASPRDPPAPDVRPPAAATPARTSPSANATPPAATSTDTETAKAAPVDDLDRTLADNPPGAGPTAAATAPSSPPSRASAAAKPRPRPAARSTPVAKGPADPRAACAGRTEFALYRCMQQQCQTARFSPHAQCIRFRALDRVE